MTYDIATISADETGIQLIDGAKRVLDAIGKKYCHDFNFCDGVIGKRAMEKYGEALPQSAIDVATKAHAVLFGASKEQSPYTLPLQSALVSLCKSLGLYAGLHPVKLYPNLANQSALKEDILSKGVDFVIVRDVVGGIYFGENGFRINDKFGREAFDTERYSELEIERVARIAYELARTRNKSVVLADKANNLTTSRLWRKIVTDINEDYPDVRLDMLDISEIAKRLAQNPAQFDVILTTNLFGEAITAFANALVGSENAMPVITLGDTTLGLYGAKCLAPECFAKNGVVNPIGEILACASMLRLSLDLDKEATAIENAVTATIAENKLPFDLGGTLTASQIADEIISRL